MQEERIRKYADVFSGYAFQANELNEEIEDGIPVLKIGNIQNKLIIKDVESYYSGRITDKIKKYKLQKNDFLVAMTGAGSVGKAGKMIPFEEGYLVNQRVAIVRPYDNVDADFLYYFFCQSHVEDYLYSLGIGAGQPNISSNDILNMKVKFPDIDKQKRISSILMNYDRLIENENRLLSILEKLLMEIFNEYFIRERNSINIINSGKLEDIAIDVGKTVNKKQRENYNHYVPIDCIDREKMVVLREASIEEAESSLVSFKKGDILFGAMRPYFHKVSLSPFDGLTRSTCIVINSKEEKYYYYLYCLLFKKESVNYASNISVGSTMPYVKWTDFKKMNIAIPNDDILIDFNKKVAPIVKRIINSYQITNNMKNQKDMVMKAIFSKKIEI